MNEAAGPADAGSRVSVDSFRTNAAKWKLSNDVEVRDSILQKRYVFRSDAGHRKLLSYLKSFSEALMKKTKDVEQQVESLVYEVKTTDICVHNSFNRFVMLANTQFIENVRALLPSYLSDLRLIKRNSESTSQRILLFELRKRLRRKRLRNQRTRRK
jgi:hypothetical protein